MKIEFDMPKFKRTSKNKIKQFTFSKFLAFFSCVVLLCVLASVIHINSKLLRGELLSYDWSVFMYLIPSSFAFCGLTLAFYFNKSRFENTMKIRYGYVESLLNLKKDLGLYEKYELQTMIDTQIANAENQTENTFINEEAKGDEEIEYRG